MNKKELIKAIQIPDSLSKIFNSLYIENNLGSLIEIYDRGIEHDNIVILDGNDYQKFSLLMKNGGVSLVNEYFNMKNAKVILTINFMLKSDKYKQFLKDGGN